MLPTRNYSAHEATFTQRPVSSSLFTVDSEDRYDNYTQARLGRVSPYDFSINLPASLMNGFFTRLALTEVVFPWAIPNVNRKTNKIICSYQIGAGPIIDEEIEIEYGFYSPSELAEVLQDAIRTIIPALPAFTMEYGPPFTTPPAIGNNSPVFFYNSGNPADKVAFKPMVPLSSQWPFSDSARQLFDVLGFSTGDNSVLATGSYGGYTFAQACRYVDIVCPQLSYNQALKDSSSQKTVRDSLCRLYIVDPANIQSTTLPSDPTFVPPGCAPTTIYRNFTLPKQIMWLPNQPITGSLRFQVYDDEGDLLSISDVLSVGPNPPSRLNWSMTLLVSEN